MITTLVLGSLPGCFPELQLKECVDFSLGVVEGCSDPCKVYCEYVSGQCPDLFTAAQCETDCRFDVPQAAKTGEPGETGRDTLACRITEARAGRCDSAGIPASVACPTADCVAYCQEVSTNCPEQYPDNTVCLTSCLTIPARSTPESQNSVECRLKQAQDAAALAGPERASACAAAGLTGGEVCGTPCEIYCNIAEQNCTADLQIYGSRRECIDICSLFPPGSRDDDFNVDGPEADSTGCRTWHAAAAGNSAGDPPIHCPHARVYNPMFCGSRFGMGQAPREWPCSTYCNLVQRNCPDRYPSASACQMDCATFPELNGLSEMDQPNIFPLTSTVCPTSG